MSNNLIRLLPWDSSHFGFKIASGRPRRLDPPTFRQLESACIEHGVDCLYFLADAADRATINILQAGRFDFVDIRITLVANVSSLLNVLAAKEFRFRIGQESDLEALLPIAAESYNMSRFYWDERFGSDKASLMYQTWFTNSLMADYADAVVVAELAGRPVGYVTCHLQKPSGEANLGLVGVAETARGMGCMSGMLQYLGCWLSSRGFDQVNVVTQGRNVPAQRAYQKSGFVTRSIELWFHRWFLRPA